MESKLLTMCAALLVANLGLSSKLNWVFHFRIKADIYFPTYTLTFGVLCCKLSKLYI